MTCHHAGRSEGLLVINAELLRTAAELTQNMARLLASTHRLVRESHRLRQESTAITVSTRMAPPAALRGPERSPASPPSTLK
jgi:hypothetical protein